MNRTLAIIKPDAVSAGHDEAIRARIRVEGIRMAEGEMRTLTREEVEMLYAEHKDRPFFADLCAFMTSGPVVIMILEGTAVVERWRGIIGPTDPRKAGPTTLRGHYGDHVGPMYRNAVHGSDSEESAEREIGILTRIGGHVARLPRRPEIHDLKCWPEDFEAIVRGDKTHEARRDDRGFAVGDTLRLHEWKPIQPEKCDWKRPGHGPDRCIGDFTGRTVDRLVTHITRNQYGLPADLAVMSLRAPSGVRDLRTTVLEPNPVTLDALSSEIVRGRTKFPGHRFMLAALVEEVGELAGAIVAKDRGAIIREAIQVAGLGIRIVEEGDEAQYRPDGFIEMVYDFGNVARFLMQRRELVGYHGSPLSMLLKASGRLRRNGDLTFADITDEEAQP